MQAIRVVAPGAHLAHQPEARSSHEADNCIELLQAAEATIEHVDQLLGDPANMCTRCRFIKQDHYQRCDRCGLSLYEGPAESSATRAQSERDAYRRLPIEHFSHPNATVLDVR